MWHMALRDDAQDQAPLIFTFHGKRPSVAVCIPSKNRAADISVCLRSIEAQTLQPKEVIVVDQSSTPYRLAEINGLRHVYDQTITGSAEARNRCAALATADVLFFIDDDVELFPNCISDLVCAFEQHPDAVALECAVDTPSQLGPLGKLHQAIFHRGFFNSNPIRRREVTELRRLAGCAMSFRRGLFDFEQFDESLVGYSFGEDWEFSKRAQRYGRLLLVPGPLLLHHVSPLNRNNMEQLQRDLWDNYLYFYDKLGAGKVPVNRFWRIWWMLGESLKWARYGLGFPLLGITTRRTPRRSASLRLNSDRTT